MITSPTKEEYLKTLYYCEEIKDRLEKLELLLNSTVNQGISNKYKEHSSNLVNWIEEIEFTITNYEKNGLTYN